MKLRLIVLIFFLTSILIYSQHDKIPVFISGNDGYKIYRIPAIISLLGGELLAFCEGRVNNSSDFGNIDIVMKRSSDKGKTWSSIQKIVDYDSLQAGNPSPVVDLTDPKYPTGRIFLFFNTGNKTESEVRSGKGLREVWYKTSADGGITWSKPVNITTQVHRPNMPNINPGYNFKEDWRSYANVPGHAMQFTSGKYKGRIFVPANHSVGEPIPHFRDYYAHGYFTDDHGKTFRLSESVNYPGSNESTAAELSNGNLMMNSRNQSGDVKARIISISSNGGQSWNQMYIDKNLIDPVCEGTLLSIGKIKGKNILAFCNAADTAKRNNLTLRLSFDDGMTWKENFLIDKDESNKDFTAYSDIVKISSNEIGILYERNDYSEIIFSDIKWKY